MLAESEIGDWIQIIILVLVFGGSALGSIVKVLIKHFGGAVGEEKNAPDAPRQQPRHPSAPTPPVARPMAPFPQRQPHVPRSVTPGGQSEGRPSRRLAPQGRVGTAPSVPRRRPPQPPPIVVSIPGSDSSQAPQPQRPSQADKKQTRQQEKSKRTPRPTADEDHGGGLRKHHIASDLADHHLQLSAALIKPETKDADIAAHEPIEDPIHHPTKATLRRAVMLSEIIGKPIALRGEEHSPWQ